MQDIKPKRSIRNITLPESKRVKVSETRSASRDNDVPPTPPRKTISTRSKSGGKRNMFLVGGILVIALLGIGALMTFFGNTSVTLVPKTAEAQLENTLTAYPQGATTDANSVLFQNVDLEKELSKDVPATDERYVEEKAQGTIIVYNDFDESSQRLITNTRFETPEGLIYRIRESIVVPGQTTVNGQVVPGSIEVTVYADEPGEAYNIDLTDFTVPGFEGDPRYDSFYARSKTPIIGGYVGNKKQVAEGVQNETIRELDATLRADLLTELQDQIPNNLTILEDLVTFEFQDMPQTTAGELVTITRKAKIVAPLFDKQNLAKELARLNNVPTDIPLEIDSYNGLTITKTENDDTETNSLSFTVSGKALFVGVIDTDTIKNSLVGKDKDELSEVLRAFPAIASAKATISPFWINTFSDNPEDIDIIISKEQVSQ